MKHFKLFLVVAVVSSSALAQEGIRITHLPYIQGLTDSSVNIVWTTNKPSTGWVELAPDDSTHFYLKERPKYFNSKYGFKMVGMVHSVELRNLKPNTVYRYRVYSQEVLKHEGVQVEYGRVAATGVYRQQPLRFKTTGGVSNISFAVINDIHGRNEVMNKLLDLADLPKTDFVVFNGDMADNLLSEEQMFSAFMDTAIKRFAIEKPMYYARGNHETRGPFAVKYPEYFPTPTGELYYQLNLGKTNILVLDCGEDKPDSDIEYSGIVDMDNYRTRQAEWLKKAVETPEFKNASYKIVICHMPPFGGWHGEEDIFNKFVPVLNKAGVQVMISGHFHRQVIRNADDKINFPVIVNSNNNLIKVDLNESGGLIRIIDQSGKTVEKMNLPSLR